MSDARDCRCGKDLLLKAEAVSRVAFFKRTEAARMRAYRCPWVKSRWHVGHFGGKPKQRGRKR